MALDELTICNRALFALGEDMIVSLTENSKAARLCNAAFATVRDAVTRRLPWNCARRRVRLAADAVAPPFQWVRSFTLPADFIRMYHLSAAGDTAYVVEGNKLLTNAAAPLDCIYIGRMDDPTLIDPLMAETIAYALAVEIGRALAQDEAAVVRVETKLASLWGQAEQTNRSEHSFHEWDEAQWLALTGLDAATATIVNRALVALGINTADRPEENVIRAKLLAAAYPSVRDAVTRRLPWNCARKRAVLSETGVPPSLQWPRAFTLPADCLRVYYLPEIDNAQWVVENGVLLSDVGSPVEVIYIKQMATASQIDAQMAETIAYALAAEAGPALDVKDQQAIGRCEQKFAALLAEAAPLNAAEQGYDDLDPARTLVLSGLASEAEAAICNQALVFLGVKAAETPQEVTKRANLVINAYPAARDGVTRRVPWNCARKREQLTADAAAPAFQWDFQYALPDDFIRMVEEPDSDWSSWAIEGGKLLSDTGPTFDALYIGRLDDATLIDPLLAEAIALAIAVKVGPVLKPDDAVAAARCHKLLDEKIRAAALASSQENSVREWDMDLWLRARF